MKNNNIHYIFFDFNGTLIDDVDLCRKLLNDILIKQGKKTFDTDGYKHVFKFPVKQYYMDAGVTFEKESFEVLANWFIDEYQPRSMDCGLYSCVVDTLEYLKKKGIHLIILSASEIGNLTEQCNHYDITKYFDKLLGIDNIYAASKTGIGIRYMEENSIPREDCIFIGDTLHDFEVASEMGIKPVLVSCGHQAKDVLEKSGVTILPDIGALKEWF